MAARTERVRITGNVLSTPLRPPAVLARAAASLDILSGGRLELGLGAGAFADGIVAMGGPRLGTAERIDAFAEAIPIIRDLWDTSARGPVHHDGRHHSVIGAKRGPRPAHDIGIWIGAYKPRMLALTGALGDGWLPSMEYLPQGPGSLPDANSRIDEATTQAGRSPADVRRLMNFMNVSFTRTGRGLLDGPPAQWIDHLTDLTLTHGITAFIIGGDDHTITERFAAEVAPAVREHVERERKA